MGKIQNVKNDPVGFLPEGDPSCNLICRVHRVPLAVIFRRDAARRCRFQFLEVCRMNAIRALTATVLLSLVCVSNSSGQDTKAVNPALAPPNLLVLVHQVILNGKATAHQ
jgi:hypothetical protein